MKKVLKTLLFTMVVGMFVLSLVLNSEAVLKTSSSTTGGNQAPPSKDASFCRQGGSTPTAEQCRDSFKASNNPCVAPQVLSGNSFCWATATKCATVGGQSGYICSCKYECVNP